MSNTEFITQKTGPKKSLGQHFLQYDWAIGELIETAQLKPADLVLEIGPGTGVLTKKLALKVKKVIAVEKDEKLADGLKQTLKQEGIDNVEIIKGDILKVLPLAKYESYRIVANIPYFLTSRLLRTIFEQRIKPQIVVLTVQKEVAQRIIARPPKMNLLALSVQIFGQPRLIKTIPAECFWPKPKVDSAIIKIDKISDSFFESHNLQIQVFFQITKTAFGQKRKLLTNSLEKIALKEQIVNALKQTKISLKARPEELTPEQWAKIVIGIRKNQL